MTEIINRHQTIKHFTLFCDQLNQLLKTGVPLTHALMAIKADEKSKEKKARLNSLIINLNKGDSLIQSLSLLLPKNTPYLFKNTPLIPNLNEFLAMLSEYYKEKINASHFLLKQLSYPLLLLLSSVIVLLSFFFLMLPSIYQFYISLSIPLPPIFITFNKTKMAFSKYQQHLYILFLIFIYPLIWYANKYIKNAILTLFFPTCYSDILWLVGISLKSGIPLKTAIKSLSHLKETPYQIQLQQFIQTFNQTGLFTISLCNHFQLSKIQTEQLKMSEKSGQLPKILIQLAKNIKTETNQTLKLKLSIVQPILLLFMGLFILISIYLTLIPLLHSMKTIL